MIFIDFVIGSHPGFTIVQAPQNPAVPPYLMISQQLRGWLSKKPTGSLHAITWRATLG
jgi:hypothetical protein